LADLGTDSPKPYQVNDTMVNQTLELKHGKSARVFLMDKVSNSMFLPVSGRSWTVVRMLKEE
jgi:RNA polymerase-associated protein RTF1